MLLDPGVSRVMVDRSKRLPRLRRWQVCSGALRRERVLVISCVATASQRSVSAWRSCQAKSGASQSRPRSTSLHAS